MTKTNDPNINLLESFELYVGKGNHRFCPESIYYRRNHKCRKDFAVAKVTVERNVDNNICINLPSGLRVTGDETLYKKAMKILGGIKGCRQLTDSTNTSKQFATEMKLKALAEEAVAQHLASNPHLVEPLIAAIQKRAKRMALNEVSYQVTLATHKAFQEYEKKA